ncbi:hypothetical protein [Brevibacterium linens]
MSSSERLTDEERRRGGVPGSYVGEGAAASVGDVSVGEFCLD